MRSTAALISLDLDRPLFPKLPLVFEIPSVLTIRHQRGGRRRPGQYPSKSDQLLIRNRHKNGCG